MLSEAMRIFYTSAVGGTQREPPDAPSQASASQMWVDFGHVLLTDLSYAVSTKLPGPKVLQILSSKWKQMFGMESIP